MDITLCGPTEGERWEVELTDSVLEAGQPVASLV